MFPTNNFSNISASSGIAFDFADEPSNQSDTALDQRVQSAVENSSFATTRATPKGSPSSREGTASTNTSPEPRAASTNAAASARMSSKWFGGSPSSSEGSPSPDTSPQPKGSSSSSSSSGAGPFAYSTAAFTSPGPKKASSSSSAAAAAPPVDYSPSALISPPPRGSAAPTGSLERHRGVMGSFLEHSPYATEPNSHQKPSLKRGPDVFEQVLSTNVPTPPTIERNTTNTYMGKLFEHPKDYVSLQGACSSTLQAAASGDIVQQVGADYITAGSRLGKKRRTSLYYTPRYIFTDIQHIISTSTGGGFHFCPPTHPMISSLRNLAISPNGTFSALFPSPSSSALKYSTFFPDSIPDIEALGAFFEDCEPMKGVREGNRALYKNGDIVVEMYYSKDRTLNSAFPIFGYFDLSENTDLINTSYPLATNLGANNDITKRALIDAATQSLQAGKTPAFTLPAKGILIVDVAPELHIPEVPRGIYVVVSDTIDLS